MRCLTNYQQNKPNRTLMLPLGVSDLPCYSNETHSDPFITAHYKLNINRDKNGNGKQFCSVQVLKGKDRLETNRLSLSFIF